MSRSQARPSGLAKLREAGILAFLALVVIAASAKAPRFLEAENLKSILLDIPLLIVVAMGMTLVIISRNIDLSVGSTLGLCAMVAGMAFRSNPNLPIPLVLLMGTALGTLLGAVNGFLVARLRVPAIIATLGTLSIYRGLVFLISDGKQVDRKDLPDALVQMAQPSALGVPALVMIAFIVAALASLFLKTQRAGREIYAVGSSPSAARLRGLPVAKTLLTVFTLTGALSGLAGVMYAARVGFVDPGQAGSGFELSVIAATVIGGTDVFGGSGSVFGTLLGCLLLGVINNALAVTGLNQMWQLAVYGAIILIAVFVDSVIRGHLGQTAREGA